MCVCDYERERDSRGNGDGGTFGFSYKLLINLEEKQMALKFGEAQIGWAVFLACWEIKNPVK